MVPAHGGFKISNEQTQRRPQLDTGMPLFGNAAARQNTAGERSQQKANFANARRI
jgi:hypothetical protein